jgi:hypothetical protein
MKYFGNATLAAALLSIALSCTPAQRPADKSERPQPYRIQRDVLGESLESFVANNPSCKPKADIVENSQMCSTPMFARDTTYAGMPTMGKLARFYQGRLYEVVIHASTSDCKEFELLSSLKQKFGEPKDTENIDGKEITPVGGFKIWQNGVSTLTYIESLGTLDLCAATFNLDALYWKVDKLKKENKTEEKEQRKRDM